MFRRQNLKKNPKVRGHLNMISRALRSYGIGFVNNGFPMTRIAKISIQVPKIAKQGSHFFSRTRLQATNKIKFRTKEGFPKTRSTRLQWWNRRPHGFIETIGTEDNGLGINVFKVPATRTRQLWMRQDYGRRSKVNPHCASPEGTYPKMQPDFSANLLWFLFDEKSPLLGGSITGNDHAIPYQFFVGFEPGKFEPFFHAKE